MIISLKDIYIEYNGIVLLDHVDFNIQKNDKIGLIGLNGVGKSSLIKQIVKYEQLDQKNVISKNNLKIGYLKQDISEFNTENILEYVCANETKLHNENLEYQAKTILNKLLILDHNQQISTLSGGQRKRLALAKTLLQEVDLLVLDEPTNHLDTNMIIYLENYLSKKNVALIMISHDRYFINNIVNKIVEIDNQQIYEYPGNYTTYLELKAQRLESEKSSYRKQVTLLKNEQAWMLQGAKARSTKSKERINKFEKLKEETKEAKTTNLVLDSINTRIGNKILEIEHIKVGYEDNVLINDFSYTMKKNDRIGIVGLNGTGKTTLLNAIANHKVLQGKLDFGSTIKIGYFNQHSYDLNDSKRVIDYIQDKAEFIETKTGTISASKLLEQFLFDAQKQYSLIEKLSGGEKRRLLLLGVLMTNPNFLILDEPTNDLDITTLIILEDYLLNFNGVILIVSHDRYFMDRIVDTLWIIKNKAIEISFDDYTSYLDIEEEADKKSITKKEYVKEKKIRLNYQEQKDLQTIESDITKIQAQLDDLTKETLANLDNYEKMLEIQQKQAVLEEELETKTMYWLELEEKQELIQTQNNKVD